MKTAEDAEDAGGRGEFIPAVILPCRAERALSAVLSEGRRDGVKHLWAPIIANVAVGVSLGLPLFLYLREQRLEER